MAIKEELIILLIIGMSACAISEERSNEGSYTVLGRCPNMPQCYCNDRSYDPTYLGCGPTSHPMTIQDYIKMFQENNVANEKRGIRMIFKGLAANSRIPSRIFEGFDIKSLDISYNQNISMWADEEGGPAFLGLENSLEKFRSFQGMTVPRKHDNYQDEKSPMSLGHLRKLREVELIYNDINTFANGWFGEGSSSLEIFTLHSEIACCKTRYFGDRAFAGLSKLKEIDISLNEVESLSRSMFPNPANHLEKMDLSYNKLTDLPDDFFTNMPALTSVFLMSNRITHIPEVVWRPVWSQLINMYLNSNPLNCDDHIQWMFEIRRPRNMWALCDEPKDMFNEELGEVINRKKGRE